MGWFKKQSKVLPYHSNRVFFGRKSNVTLVRHIYCLDGIWVLKEEFDFFRASVNSMMCCCGEFMILRRD